MAINKRIRKVVAGEPKVINTDMGVPGDPINRSHPFYFGFVATIGALAAFVLMRALASASQIFVLILIALFLATGLNPAVEALRRRGLSRSNAVGAIFVSVILFVIFFSLIVVPPVVTQGTNLINQAPGLIQGLESNSLITRLNEQYGILDTLQKEIAARTSDGKLLLTTFGGVVGVGKSVLSGTFSALTILVLTLYFLTSLPQMINLGLRLAPASRRPRVGALTEAIVARVGSAPCDTTSATDTTAKLPAPPLIRPGLPPNIDVTNPSITAAYNPTNGLTCANNANATTSGTIARLVVIPAKVLRVINAGVTVIDILFRYLWPARKDSNPQPRE